MKKEQFEHITSMFGNDRYINLLDEVHNHFPSFNDINRKSLQNFNKFLKDKASNIYLIEHVIMFHGTSAKHNIEEEGIKKTTSKTKKSMQSETGFTYLSMFHDSAKTFAEMAYPHDNIKIYAVKVPLFDLKVDKDQLKNKRYYGDYQSDEIKDTLADSLIYGSGARIKRDAKPYEVRDVTELFHPQLVNKKKNKLK